jgi:peptidoglycan/LPS O-acetylase OafA/YrhL
MNQSKKLLSLEGLRGLGAFVVVIAHIRPTFYMSSSEEILAVLSKFLPYAVARLLLAAVDGLCNGSFAVWIFWIMSAFVLSSQYFFHAKNASLTQAHDYLEDACLRRYPRLLLPVLASVIFAYLILSLGLMYNLRLAQALGTGSWMVIYYTFSPNLLDAIGSAVWQSFFAFDSSSTYNYVLWTMEKEFYGSLFLFAFLSVFGHRESRFFAYLFAALVILALRIQWLNAFVFGIALCDFYVNRSKDLFEDFHLRWPRFYFACNSKLIAALLWLVIFICVGFKNKGGVTYLLIGAIAVTAALVSTPTQRVLSSPIAVFMGKISFGLYLIHFPIICSFSSWAYLAIAPMLGASAAALLVSMASCAVSIVAGFLLYLCADRPAINLSRKLSSRIMRMPKQMAKPL